MSLTGESRTVLKLILVRGKNYAEIAALLGTDDSAARARAHTALAELAGSAGPGLDPDVADFLLGQDDQLSAAATRRRIASDPGLEEQVETIEEQLDLIAPSARDRSGSPRAAGTGPKTGRDAAPKKPAPVPDDGAAATEGRTASPRLGGGLSAGQRNLVAVLLGAALLAAILILVLTGGLGGSDDGERSGDSPAPTTAVLHSASGESGEGSAQIGFNSQGGLAVNLQVSGLKPSSSGETYALWFDGPKGAFPIDQSRAGADGAVAKQVPLLGPEICLVADGVFSEFRLTRVARAALRRDVRARRQNRNDDQLPGAAGRTVMTGQISMPQDAKDQIIRQCSATGNTAGG